MKRHTVKIYKAWLELDSKNAFSVLVPVSKEKDVLEYVSGNGKIITITDETNNEHYIDKIRETLDKIEDKEMQELFERLIRFHIVDVYNS